MAVPCTFANQSGEIPLSELDANFAALPHSFKMEALAVGLGNSLSNLSEISAYQTGLSNGIFLLIVNGQIFVPIGTFPAFSVTGTTVTWLSTIFGLNSSDFVFAVYSY